MPSRTIRRRRRRCRRPRHTILPGTVLRGDEPEFLLACIGLNNHPQGQVQTLVNVLDLGMNPQRAVDAAVPRGDDLRQGATRRGLFGTDRSGTGRAGHQIGAPSAFKGAAQIVRIRRGEEGVGPCLETGSITGSTGSPSAGNAGGPDGLSGPRCRFAAAREWPRRDAAAKHAAGPATLWCRRAMSRPQTSFPGAPPAGSASVCGLPGCAAEYPTTGASGHRWPDHRG